MNTRGLGSWDERSIYEYRGFRVFGLGVESPGVLDNAEAAAPGTVFPRCWKPASLFIL